MNHFCYLRGLVLIPIVAILLLICGGDRHTWVSVSVLTLVGSILLCLADWSRDKKKEQQDASVKVWQDALLQQVAKAASEISLTQLNEHQGAMNQLLDKFEKTASVGAKQLLESFSGFFEKTIGMLDTALKQTLDVQNGATSSFVEALNLARKEDRDTRREWLNEMEQIRTTHAQGLDELRMLSIQELKRQEQQNEKILQAHSLAIQDNAKKHLEDFNLFQRDARKGEDERRQMWVKEVEVMNNSNKKAVETCREKMLEQLGAVLEVQKDSLGSFVERVEGVSDVVTQAIQTQNTQKDAILEFTRMIGEFDTRLSSLFFELAETRKKEREAFEQMQARAQEVSSKALEDQERAWNKLLEGLGK